jgi:hypothetical protein
VAALIAGSSDRSPLDLSSFVIVVRDIEKCARNAIMKGFFAEDYWTARSAFLSECRSATCRLATYRYESDAQDSSVELAIDTARFGADDARHVLTIVSGTHGIEGFCGSACQLACIQLGLIADLPQDVAVLMIHALNPHGFAHYRRVTDSNVDLNRNGVGTFDPMELRTINSDYEKLNELLNPVEWRAEQPHVGFDDIMKYIQQWGFERFQRAVSIGQYQHPHGLFYGGAEPCWSRAILEKIIATELANTKGVVVIDYHTGLGPPSHGELISTSPPGSPAYELAVSIFGQQVKSTKTANLPVDCQRKSLAPDIVGSIDALFNKDTLTYVALEFGTVMPLEVLEALRADNWFHHYGKDRPELQQQIATDMRKAFYPDTEEWRQSVLHRSAEVLTRALTGISKYEKEVGAGE